MFVVKMLALASWSKQKNDTLINLNLTNIIVQLLGVTHVAGDMFVSVPEADAVFIKVSFYF